MAEHLGPLSGKAVFQPLMAGTCLRSTESKRYMPIRETFGYRQVPRLHAIFAIPRPAVNALVGAAPCVNATLGYHR
jgi:hypothetical protein